MLTVARGFNGSKITLCHTSDRDRVSPHRRTVSAHGGAEEFLVGGESDHKGVNTHSCSVRCGSQAYRWGIRRWILNYLRGPRSQPALWRTTKSRCAGHTPCGHWCRHFRDTPRATEGATDGLLLLRISAYQLCETRLVIRCDRFGDRVERTLGDPPSDTPTF